MAKYDFAFSFCWLPPLTRPSVVRIPTGKNRFESLFYFFAIGIYKRTLRKKKKVAGSQNKRIFFSSNANARTEKNTQKQTPKEIKLRYIILGTLEQQSELVAKMTSQQVRDR